MNTSDLIDKKIIEVIQSFNNSNELVDNNFENLISLGELIDRLSIVNFKLYNLKDEVMSETCSEEFKAEASVKDVYLVRERARLKKCIDEKVLYMMSRILKGDTMGGFNPEVKKYG